MESFLSNLEDIYIRWVPDYVHIKDNVYEKVDDDILEDVLTGDQIEYIKDNWIKPPVPDCVNIKIDLNQHSIETFTQLEIELFQLGLDEVCYYNVNDNAMIIICHKDTLVYQTLYNILENNYCEWYVEGYFIEHLTIDTISKAQGYDIRDFFGV